MLRPFVNQRDAIGLTPRRPFHQQRQTGGIGAIRLCQIDRYHFVIDELLLAVHQQTANITEIRAAGQREISMSLIVQTNVQF